MVKGAGLCGLTASTMARVSLRRLRFQKPRPWEGEDDQNRRVVETGSDCVLRGPRLSRVVRDRR